MRSTSVSRCSPVCSQKSEKRPKVTHSLGRRAKDEHATVEDRFTAALDLASLAPDPQQVAEVTPMLLAWLERDEHLRLKIAAVNSLGDLGKGDKRVVPALIKALDHPSRPVHVGPQQLSPSSVPNQTLPFQRWARFSRNTKGILSS